MNKKSPHEEGLVDVLLEARPRVELGSTDLQSGA